MATGLLALGTAAVTAGGEAASAPGAPSMTAPLGVDQTVTFGGAHKGTKNQNQNQPIQPSTAILVSAGLIAAVVVYAVAPRK